MPINYFKLDIKQTFQQLSHPKTIFLQSQREL